MVTVYGMNEKVGNVSFYDPSAEQSFTKPYSEETSKLIDEEVRNLINEAFVYTKKLLTEKRDKVELLAEALLDKEVLFQSDVEKLIGKRPYEEKKAADVVHDNPPLHPAHPLEGNGAGNVPVPGEVQQ